MDLDSCECSENRAIFLNGAMVLTNGNQYINRTKATSEDLLKRIPSFEYIRSRSFMDDCDGGLAREHCENIRVEYNFLHENRTS